MVINDYIPKETPQISHSAIHLPIQMYIYIYIFLIYTDTLMYLDKHDFNKDFDPFNCLMNISKSS